MSKLEITLENNEMMEHSLAKCNSRNAKMACVIGVTDDNAVLTFTGSNIDPKELKKILMSFADKL